eukprot:5683085-Ditylum_brightwellii.AAC.1
MLEEEVLELASAQASVLLVMMELLKLLLLFELAMVLGLKATAMESGLGRDGNGASIAEVSIVAGSTGVVAEVLFLVVVAEATK